MDTEGIIDSISMKTSIKPIIACLIKLILCMTLLGALIPAAAGGLKEFVRWHSERPVQDLTDEYATQYTSAGRTAGACAYPYLNVSASLSQREIKHYAAKCAEDLEINGYVPIEFAGVDIKDAFDPEYSAVRPYVFVAIITASR